MDGWMDGHGWNLEVLFVCFFIVLLWAVPSPRWLLSSIRSLFSDYVLARVAMED